jgi:hypothetical protein
VSLALAKEVVYLLATRVTPSLEGADWEQIFARLIDARWKPSNVGLDDVVLEQTAWSAKTVKASSPALAKKVRLISGRNSPAFSFQQDNIRAEQPQIIGDMVLAIWNERVAAIRSKYQHLRTIVLLKSDDLLELALFEHETELYHLENYRWSWNKRDNLEGHSFQGEHKFTWQPHGSQFTIIEHVPDNRLALILKQPPALSREAVLAGLNFNANWVQVLGARSTMMPDD